MRHNTGEMKTADVRVPDSVLILFIMDADCLRFKQLGELLSGALARNIGRSYQLNYVFFIGASSTDT